MDKSIEVRVPGADWWVKQVTSVDWDGKFLCSGKLVNLDPGTLIADCDHAGSRKNWSKSVALRLLLPDGEFVVLKSCVSREWAIELREVAREYLALGNADRIALCLGRLIKRSESDMSSLTDAQRQDLDKYRKMLADLQASQVDAPARRIVLPTEPTVENKEKSEAVREEVKALFDAD